MTLEGKFAERVRVESEPSTDLGACWRWGGKINHCGYARLYVGEGREVMAHRFSYELHVGVIPDGLDLDHLCRVRDCVNPAHLEPVTRRENLLRGETAPARESRLTHCRRGHPYDEVNTYRAAGKRYCRACWRERDRSATGRLVASRR